MIVRNYLLLTFIVLSSTLSAQWLNLTTPKKGIVWTKGEMERIAWDSYNVDGNIKIEWSNSGYWGSWDTKEVTINEEYINFYVSEEHGGNNGVFYIQISSVEQSSLSDKVQIKISDNTSQKNEPEEEYLLITKYDNIRAGPSAYYNIIGNCDVNEYYPVLESQGNWYKIQLPYQTAYTHNSNGYIIYESGKTSWEARGIIWEGTGEYKYKNTNVGSFSGNYWSLISGGIFGGFNFKPKLTYGYMLSGPMFKLGPLLIGAGSLSSDYHSTYRVGLGLNDYTDSEEIDYYYMILENFMDNNDIEHFIIDFGSQFIMMDPNVFIQLGYRYQYNEENKKTIHSHLSGLHFDIGLYLGGLW